MGGLAGRGGSWLVGLALVGTVLLVGAVRAGAVPPRPIPDRPGGRLTDRDDPLASDRARATVERFADGRREEVERRKQDLKGSDKRGERDRSRAAYKGLARDRVAALAREKFPELFEAATSAKDRLEATGRITAYLDDFTARVDRGGGRGSVLAVSSLPLRQRNATGAKAPVDLALRAVGSDFASVNPIVDARLPGRLSRGVMVGSAQLGVSMEGAVDAPGLLEGDGKAVTYGSAFEDADVLVTPAELGLEIAVQIRSPAAPETFTWRLALPAGAQLRPEGEAAVVVRGDRELARISQPRAYDAQGQELSSSLRVAGDQIVLSVAHRDRDVAYPATLDPLVTESFNASTGQTWYDGGNLGALDTYGRGSGTDYPYDWSFVDGPSGSFRWGTSCWADGPGDDCYGSGRGLQIWMPPGLYPGGAYGEWVYTIPGYRESPQPTTYIAGTTFSHMNINCRGDNTLYPYVIDGIYSPRAGNWTGYYAWPCGALNFNYSHGPGNNVPNPDTFGGTIAAFALATQYTAGRGTWADGYLGGAEIYLDDPEEPTLTGVPAQSVDPAQWTDGSQPRTVTASATDPGLGVKYFNLDRQDLAGWTSAAQANYPCNGTRTARCPRNWTTSLSYDTSQLPEGITNYRITPYDPDYSDPPRPSNPWTVKIDRTAPDLTLGGALSDRAASGYVTADTTLTFDARDGIGPPEPCEGGGGEGGGVSGGGPDTGGGEPCPDPGPTGPQASGVSRIDIQVDDPENTSPPEQTYTPTCAGSDNCSASDIYTFRPASFPPDGEHTVTVIAKDRLGQTSTRTLRIVSDTQPPSIGPAESDITNGWVDDAAVSVAATDSGSGVQSVSVAADGWAGQTENAECEGTPSSPCPPRLSLEFATDDIPAGVSSLTITARDATNRSSTFTLPAKLDRDPPSLTLSGTLGGAQSGVLFGPTYSLTADASDALAGARTARFYVDDADASVQEFPQQDGASRQATFEFAASQYSDGLHEVTAVFEDAAGNRDEQTLPVIVNRGGGLVVAAVGDNARDHTLASATGTQSVTVTGSHELLGVKRVAIEAVGGAELSASTSGCILVCPKVFSAGLSYSTANLPEGEHQLRATAQDALGTPATSPPWTVVVDRSPPPAPSDFSVDDYDAANNTATITWEDPEDPDLPDGALGSGVAMREGRYRVNDGAWSAWTETNEELVVSSTAVGDKITVEARLTDAAGGVSPVSADELTVEADAGAFTDFPVAEAASADTVVVSLEFDPGDGSSPVPMPGAPVRMAGSGFDKVYLTNSNGDAYFTGASSGAYRTAPVQMPGDWEIVGSQTVDHSAGSVERRTLLVKPPSGVKDFTRCITGIGPIICRRFFVDAARAIYAAATLFPRSVTSNGSDVLDKTRANAFKHAFAVASFARTMRTVFPRKDINLAYQFARGHELDDRRGKLPERQSSFMDTNNNQVGFDYTKKVRPRNNIRQLCDAMRLKARRAKYVYLGRRDEVPRQKSGGLYRRLIYIVRSPGPQNNSFYPRRQPCRYALSRFEFP